MLNGCTLRCADRTIEGGGDVSVSLDEYLNYPFSIQLDGIESSLVESGVAALNINPTDIDLLVLVAAPRLRFVDTIFQQDLGSVSELPDHIPLSFPTRPRALRAPHGGADLRVYFCLNKALPPRTSAHGVKGPGSPSRNTESVRICRVRVRADSHDRRGSGTLRASARCRSVRDAR